MYDDFYTELYEAVYFFDRIYGGAAVNSLRRIGEDAVTGLSDGVYKAVIRILAVNDLLDYDGDSFTLTDENKAKHRAILANVSRSSQAVHCAEMYDKALDESHFFFEKISELEYEIYSRCNFQVTYETGKAASGYLDFANKKILELGGNSGGFATAVLTKTQSASYTIVDAEIPCNVGNEFKETTKANIRFIEADVFDMALPDGAGAYDCIIIMNLLHDFDDEKCLKILSNSTKYCSAHTKFIIIEDILTNEFETHEVISHGLRLSVECRGGRQRTVAEFAHLFANIGYKLERSVSIDEIFTMLEMKVDFNQ